jgi:1-hydroxycarotenoid 3,4-desaturase
LKSSHVIIIGAGISGLVCALLLSAQGVRVTVLERAATPGGKMREVEVDGVRIDAGPTVLTMRPVFERIFAQAGLELADHLSLSPATTLARHSWSEGERLDLFADPARSADAIGSFAGAREAEGYLAFCKDARGVFETLERPFIDQPSPSMPGLLASQGLAGLPRLIDIRPFSSLWKALGDYFQDQRLRQLFARYATYCGSSPFLSPATLMLIAHAEQSGVWLVNGGMHALARALEGAARAKGATFRYGAHIREIRVSGQRATGVTVEDGEVIEADGVVFTGDTAALAGGLLGRDAARAAPRRSRSSRSLSAVTFALNAPTSGFPLTRHNVFFSRDYVREFKDISQRGSIPDEPTIYVCAQDRGDDDCEITGPERLFCLVNAPARGDTDPLSNEEIERCRETTFTLLSRHGLQVDRSMAELDTTDPMQFERLFPGTGGALYGPASHGWRASFTRPGVKTKIAGLYLAGGSVHPGAGVPMAATSGRWAAATLLSDFASTGKSPTMAISGGTSTP